MANYSVKLVDHTGTPEHWRHGLSHAIQKLFDQCFEGTSDTVHVKWGMGELTDNLVIHFVEDVDHSYVQKKLPGKELGEDIGGHTRTQREITGSEFYKFVGESGKRSQYKYDGYAKIAVHEALHNLFPGWGKDELHGPNGGGGLASKVPHLPPTEKNKEMLQRGLSIKNAQLL